MVVDRGIFKYNQTTLLPLLLSYLKQAWDYLEQETVVSRYFSFKAQELFSAREKKIFLIFLKNNIRGTSEYNVMILGLRKRCEAYSLAQPK